MRLAIEINGEIKTQIPETWTRVVVEEVDEETVVEKEIVDPTYRRRSLEVYLADGWRPIQQPALTENQRRGNDLFFDSENDVWTYNVIDLTPEKIEERELIRVISEAQSRRKQAIVKEQERRIMQDKNAITDPEEALENQDFFPLWQPDITVSPPEKYQHFVENEMRLYEVIQAHTTQSDWTPERVPALFVRVLPQGSANIWVAGIQVTVGEEWLYEPNGNTYIVVQSHTTQAQWRPPNTPSLWRLKN